MKKLVKDAYKNISINNMKQIKGGEGSNNPTGDETNLTCFCKGRCFTGIDCTKGWY